MPVMQYLCQLMSRYLLCVIQVSFVCWNRLWSEVNIILMIRYHTVSNRCDVLRAGFTFVTGVWHACVFWWSGDFSHAGFCCYWTNYVRDESNGSELTFWRYSLAFLSVFLCPRVDNGKKRTVCRWKSCILERVVCVLKIWTARCAQPKIVQWQHSAFGGVAAYCSHTTEPITTMYFNWLF